MKKISLALIGFYFGVLASFAQTSDQDTSTYKSRKLNVDEINIVSSCYHQEGNSSPVTGGIGTEKLTDLETTVELKLSSLDAKNRQHTFLVEAGISHYTSASSDKIDPSTISSASSRDTRYFPSASYTINNEKKGIAFGVNASYSKEFDYSSFGYGINFAKTSQDKNRELLIKLNAFQDTYTIILPIELRDPSTIISSGGGRIRYRYPTKARNTYDASFVFTQVINMRLQIALLCDIAYQEGFLSTPFHREYFSNGSEGLEVLPNSHFKIPVGMRANYFLGDRIVIRTFYRYYQDDWGLRSHTINIETPIKLSPFVSLSPFYRFYVQSAVNYYGGYGQNDVLSTYHTTDDDLSKFYSNFLGLGIRFSPSAGILGIKNFSMLELRYGFYKRSNGLVSNIVSLNLKFK